MAAVIFIHGTYAGTGRMFGAKVDGMGTFQAQDGKGDAEESAIKRLAGFPGATVFSFFWDGGDTAGARKAAGAQLYPWIRTLKSTFGKIALVTHSHGGNVAGHAMNIDRSLTIDGAYLLACPIMSGDAKAWAEPGSIGRVGTLHTFSHPYDTVQVTLARARNAVNTGTGLGWGVGYKLPGIKNISINPGGFFQKSAHSAMHTAEGFRMAARALGR